MESPMLTTTASGRRRLTAALGAKTTRTKDWDEAKAKYLPRLAFGGAPDVQTGKVRPSVAVLAQRLGVQPTTRGRAKRKVTSARAAKGGAASARKGAATRQKNASGGELPADVTSVVDAWLCKSLGVAPKTTLTLDVVRGALLSREFSTSTRILSTVVNIAAASLSGATSGDDDSVTDALTSRWLFESPSPSATTAAAPVELIATKALQAAAGPDARQFGPNKVFIGSVWRALLGDPEIARLGEETFKRQLAEAHRRGLLKLGRADLVAAMDPSEVSASEIVHQNATYHFILRGASA
jgi:hypothetical protein